MTTEVEIPSDAAPAGSGGITVRGVTKRFPGVVANHDVNLTIRPGTVHALIGENGAGKSTLMKILYGVQKPDEGTIEVDGAPVQFASPTDAIRSGIGMVFQHFMLADNLTVLENVVLGAEHLHGIGPAADAEIRRISADYGFELEPDQLVEELGVGQRQRVEILKVLYRGARTIILDEPTAVLVPQEVDALFVNLRELRATGHTILFISHKLDEVLGIADDITVMRRGETVGEADPRTATKKQLAELMVGSELPSPETEESTVTDTVLLELDGVRLTGGTGRTLLRDIAFTIHRGEILGIAGVEGNGQAELVETIVGIRRASAGRIVLADQDLTHWSTRRRRESGIGFIPEDRHRHGLVLDAPLWENRLLGHQTSTAMSRFGFVRRGAAKAGHPADRRAVRRPHPLDHHPCPGAVGRQPAEADRRAGDERRPGAADRGPPHARRRRRCAGRDLGPHQGRAPQRPGGAADLRRPRRADRTLGPDPGDPARLARRRVRPRHRHTPRARVSDDRRRGAPVTSLAILRKVGQAALAPLIAVVAAAVVTSLVVWVADSSVSDFWDVMLTAPAKRNWVNIINQTSMLFLAGVAAAIGFRMNLFNIGVEGQYTLAAYCAAVVAGAAFFPGTLNIWASLVVAMLVGGIWAGIAGLLKVTRGVSEVISTIMLNSIALTLVGYFLNQYGDQAGQGRRTTPIPDGSKLVGQHFGYYDARGTGVWALAFLAIVIGIVMSVVINRTRFGFDLRTTGHNEEAAIASGVNIKKMIVVAMLLSGAVAGLIWMPALFGGADYYGTTFQRGLGFTGIAVALLGRNRPLGIAIGAALFAWLSVQANPLQLTADISPSVVQVTQGVVVLAVVIAYEVVRRWSATQERKALRRALDRARQQEGAAA